MPERHNPLRRQGFTLIEVLVTISIIAVLTALAISGMSAIQKTMRERKTKVTLSSAMSIFAEYDRETTLKRQPPYMWEKQTSPTVAPTKYTATDFNIWRDADPTTAGENALTAPRGIVEELDREATSVTARDDSQAVRNTAVILREAARFPTVKKMMAGLPTDSSFKIPSEPDAPVLLDAWRNPIIFVPVAGLANVYLGDSDDGKAYVITSVRSIDQATIAVLPLLVPGARPFFASAGPDGAFDFIDVNGNGNFDLGIDTPAGNDNVYSFAE